MAKMSSGMECQYPIGFASDTADFIGKQFDFSHGDGEMPVVKSNHEAFGIMAEKNSFLQAFASGVNRSTKDALSAMPDSDEGFVQACDMAYSACVEAAKAAVWMAMHMRNIINQRSVYAGQEAGKTPLETMAEEDAGEVLDELTEEELSE